MAFLHTAVDDADSGRVVRWRNDIQVGGEFFEVPVELLGRLNPVRFDNLKYVGIVEDEVAYAAP